MSASPSRRRIQAAEPSIWLRRRQRGDFICSAEKLFEPTLETVMVALTFPPAVIGKLLIKRGDYVGRNPVFTSETAEKLLQLYKDSVEKRRRWSKSL